jgi:hypothetical protein
MHRAGCQGTLSVKKGNLAAFHFNTVKELETFDSFISENGIQVKSDTESAYDDTVVRVVKSKQFYY